MDRSLGFGPFVLGFAKRFGDCTAIGPALGMMGVAVVRTIHHDIKGTFDVLRTMADGILEAYLRAARFNADRKGNARTRFPR
jgi:hypothetical protein